MRASSSELSGGAAQLVRPSGRAAHELVRVDPALLALAAEALDVLLHERLVLGEALRVERLKLRAHALHRLAVRGFHLDPRAVLGGVEEEGADGAPGRPGGEHGGERELLARALLGAGGRGRGVGLRGRAAATAGRRVVLGAAPQLRGAAQRQRVARGGDQLVAALLWLAGGGWGGVGGGLVGRGAGQGVGDVVEGGCLGRRRRVRDLSTDGIEAGLVVLLSVTPGRRKESTGARKRSSVGKAARRPGSTERAEL